MIDVKKLAIDLFMLPEKKRKSLLRNIPVEQRTKLEQYFFNFEVAQGVRSASAEPARFPVQLGKPRLNDLPSAMSPALRRRVNELLEGADTFPPMLAKTLREFCRPEEKSNGHG